MRQMNLFGDDETEARTEQTDGADFFFSDMVQTTEDDISVNESAYSNSRKGYGYAGRTYTSKYYDDTLEQREPIKKSDMHDKQSKSRYKNRDSAYNNNVHYYNTNKPYRSRPMRSSYGMHNRRPSGYHTSSPSFSKEQNGKFIIGVFGIALIALLIVFVCRGDSAFAGVTTLILIMYAMNYLTKNKKGPRGK